MFRVLIVSSEAMDDAGCSRHDLFSPSPAPGILHRRRVIAVGLVTAGLSLSVEFTGYVSDAACGWNNARNSPEAKQCARKCVGAGWDPVFVRDGQMEMLKIRNKAAVKQFVGDHVAVTGDVKRDILTVRKIRKAPQPSKHATASTGSRR